MPELIPIIFRLEIKAGAKRINLNEKSVPVKTLKRPMKSGSTSNAASRKRFPRPSATYEDGEHSGLTLQPSQRQCFGARTYSEVVVETLRKTNEEPTAIAESVQPSTSRSSVMSRAASSSIDPGPDCLRFSSGNPLIEKTTGIIHFYKNRSPIEIMSDNCWTLCMMEIPAYVTCPELLRFISPAADGIMEAKIVRDGSPNQYFVLIKFASSNSAFNFYQQFNGVDFNYLETAKCNLFFVERIETETEERGGSLPLEGSTELPSCAVCLERLDDGVITILCNHSFHAECLQHWEDTTCPVCRFNQTPELLPDQTCTDCGKTSDLWMCLICGNIGCGRYAEAHACRHFEATSHTFALQLGGNLVWDYAGDNYVHRLIQNSADGKMVEFQGTEDNKSDEKMNAVQLEYSCLLSSQLENQRIYFEERIREIETNFQASRVASEDTALNLSTKLSSMAMELSAMKAQIQSLTGEKLHLEKKCQKTQQIIRKLQSELEEERQLSCLIRADKETLAAKNAELEKLRSNEIKALEEQVNDLMSHFDAQNKLAQQVSHSALTTEELHDSSLLIQQNASTKKTKRRNK